MNFFTLVFVVLLNNFRIIRAAEVILRAVFENPSPVLVVGGSGRERRPNLIEFNVGLMQDNRVSDKL